MWKFIYIPKILNKLSFTQIHSYTLTHIHTQSTNSTWVHNINPSHTHTHLLQKHNPSPTLSLKTQKPALHNIIHHTLTLTYFKNTIQHTLWVKNPKTCTSQQYSARIHTHVIQNTHTYWYTHTLYSNFFIKYLMFVLGFIETYYNILSSVIKNQIYTFISREYIDYTRSFHVNSMIYTPNVGNILSSLINNQIYTLFKSKVCIIPQRFHVNVIIYIQM